MKYSSIEEKIVLGLQKTSKDLIWFNGNFNIDIKPEYLITANIAKAISELNYYHGIPYKIKLEESTKKFSKLCVKNFKCIINDNNFEEKIKTSKHNVKRNGRFDICIYEEKSDHAVTAIELKLLNPKKKDLFEDILRLSEILLFSDVETGNSLVKYSYFSALLFSKKIIRKKQVENFLKKKRTYYETILNDITNKNFIKFEIRINTIDDRLLFDPSKMILYDDIFNSDLDYQSKYFAGLIIRLSKK